MKILHFADAHLRDKDIEEAEKCLNFLIETARSEKVDLIINAGDTFDSQEIKLDSKSARLAIRVVSELADIAPVAIVLGTPSHDGKSPEILRFVKGKYPVHVSCVPEQVMLPGIDAVITLIPQPTKQFFQTESGIAESDQEIGNAMSGLFAGFGAKAADLDCPHILVGHFTESGAMLSNGQVRTGVDIEVSLEQIKLARPDLICLGHIHLPQGNYSGSIYANNVGENHKHGFFIHELDNLINFTWNSRFIETPAKKLLRIQEDFTGEDGVAEMDAVLYSYSQEDLANAYIRCDFTVWQDEVSLRIDKDKLTAFFLSAGALDVDIRIVRVPRQNVRSEAVLKADRLRDKIQKMAELKEEAVEESILVKAEYLESMPSDELTGGLA